MVCLIVLMCWVLAAVPVAAAEDRVVRIGILTSPLGGMEETNGEGMVLAAQMAVEDFGGTVLGKPIEVIAADHQNRPSVGATIARRWLEHGGADVIMDVPNASVAEAVRQTVREHHGLMIQSQAGILARPECQTNVITWTFDGDLVVRNLVAVMKEHDRENWLLLSPDTRHSNESAAAVQDVMRWSGGKLSGDYKFALPATAAEPNADKDLADKLLAAHDAVVFLNAGPSATKSAALRLHHALAGHRVAQIYSPSYLALRDGKNLTEITDELIYALPYRRDNPVVMALVERFALHADGRKPTPLQIGLYAAVAHYLHAVRTLGTDQPGELVGAKMEELPVNDPIFGKGMILADGRRIGDTHVMTHHTGDSRDQTLASWLYAEHAGDVHGTACGALPK
jgi:branched-chain amino acid transport system substrate-binding protein